MSVSSRSVPTTYIQSVYFFSSNRRQQVSPFRLTNGAKAMWTFYGISRGSSSPSVLEAISNKVNDFQTRNDTGHFLSGHKFTNDRNKITRGPGAARIIII